MQLLVIFLVAGTAIGTWAYVWHTRADSLADATENYAIKVGLPLHQGLVPLVAGRLSRRERAGAVGAVGAIWLTAGALLASSARLDQTDHSPMLVPLAFFIGHALGLGAVAWYESTRPSPAEGPRVARVATPGHGDYVPAIERYGAWVAAGLSVVIALATVVIERTGVADLGGIPWPFVATAIVLPVLAVVVNELLVGRLLSRRQVAASTAELAWDDALRARTLRDMVTVPLTIAAGAPLVLLAIVERQLLGTWPENPAAGVVSVASWVLLVGYVVVSLAAWARKPHRHFRRRLWPEAPTDALADAPIGSAAQSPPVAAGAPASGSPVRSGADGRDGR